MEETPEDPAVVRSQRQIELWNATAIIHPLDGDLESCANSCILQQQGEAAPQGQETSGCRQPCGDEGIPFKQIDRDLDEHIGVVYSL